MAAQLTLPATFYPQLPEEKRQRLARHVRQRQRRIEKVQQAQERVLRRARKAAPDIGKAIIESAVQSGKFPILEASYGIELRPCGDCDLPFDDEYHPRPTRLCKYPKPSLVVV